MYEHLVPHLHGVPARARLWVAQLGSQAGHRLGAAGGRLLEGLAGGEQ